MDEQTARTQRQTDYMQQKEGAADSKSKKIITFFSQLGKKVPFCFKIINHV